MKTIFKRFAFFSQEISQEIFSGDFSGDFSGEKFLAG